MVQVAAEREEPELLELTPKLHEWQRWFLIHALELLEEIDPSDPQYLFRFRTVLLLVARQNGKTALMVYLILWRLFHDGARLVIGSAQTIDVAEEAWETVVSIAEAIPELDEDVKRVSWGSGKRSLTLEANEQYKVVPSNRGGGRSKSGDMVLMDELREQTSWDAWAGVSKTTMARPRAQLIGFSNAGDAASIVLRTLRMAAHLALGDPDGINAEESLLDATSPEQFDADEDQFDPIDDSALGIFEWSAKPGVNRRDKTGWAQANPSLGLGRLTERAISAALTDPEWIFRTEVLCQWSAGSLSSQFPPNAWEAAPLPPIWNEDEGEWEPNPEGGCADPESTRWKKAPRLAIGVDTSWDRSWTYVATASVRKDGKIHVEVIARRAGTDWVVPYLEERVEKQKISVVAFQKNGAPISSIFDDAEKADIPLEVWEGADLARWTGIFYDRVVKRDIRHRSQPVLNIAVANANVHSAGDSWIWDRKNSPVDIASLVAVTAAVGALLNGETDVESAYADDDADVVFID